MSHMCNKCGWWAVFPFFWGWMTVVSVSNGVGFCVKNTFVTCNVALRQYLNVLAKMGIMDGS